MTPIPPEKMERITAAAVDLYRAALAGKDILQRYEAHLNANERRQLTRILAALAKVDASYLTVREE